MARDVLVIGAGVVGLAVARALALAGDQVLVAEATGQIGSGVSSRNSEVLHAGLYYKPGSLKARVCVAGRAQLVAYCEARSVPYALCGKLVVATAEDQVPALRTLQEKATANGVRTAWLTAQEARAREPALHCVAALHSPDTGIVDSHSLMLALQADLEAAGGQVAFASPIVGGVLGQAGAPHVVRIGGEPLSEWTFDVVVNAAALSAVSVAASFEGSSVFRLPAARFAKGNYCALTGKAPFKHLIYPAPQDAWLGVHLTLDLAGQARFGPDIHWLDTSDPADLNYDPTPGIVPAFEESVRAYWPGLPDGALHPTYTGIRPKIHGAHEPAPDFRVDGPAQHGVPGWVNLLGIESPGLTSSMALADHVVNLLKPNSVFRA
jgi:L-2-hydroxyglutarate oxidase LhgO